MIEELTSQVLLMGLLFVVFLAPPLALAIGLVLLALYRRAVVAAMARPAKGSAPLTAGPDPSPRVEPVGAGDASGLDGELPAALLRDRKRAIVRVCVAGVAYAATIAVALIVAMESMRTPLGAALGAWGAFWPVIPALWLTVPGGGRAALVAALIYLMPLAALAIVAVFASGDATDMEALVLSIRAGWSPPELIRAWVLMDAVPTALLLLVLNRWTRAVGPLTLAFASLLLAGLAGAYLALASTRGVATLLRLAAVSKVDPATLENTLLLVVLGAGVVIGWVAVGRMRRSYSSKRANDRSLTLDGAWLVFAAFHSMLFALVGLGWVVASLVAFVVWRVTLGLVPLATAAERRTHPQGLVFLRVFSLGRRTEKLFDALSRFWRHRGSVQLIIGPDLVRSTVQPHQMLDFVSGQLAHHFIGDAASLRRQIDACDRARDRDGLYRINSLFCHADTWESALAALVGQGDRVLMDLRSFGPSNDGCRAELEHLVHHVPLGRCVWVVDAGTNADFLARTLDAAWRTMPADSPNAAIGRGSAPLYRLAGGWHGIGRLLDRLAAAT